MTRRSPRKTLKMHIDLFFKLCASVAQLKQRLAPAQLHDIRLEAFIGDPRSQLADLCAFLGVAAEQRYLEDCAGIVFPSVKKSRFDIEWNADSIAEVGARMEQFSFLSGYDYEKNESRPAGNLPIPSQAPSRLH